MGKEQMVDMQVIKLVRYLRLAGEIVLGDDLEKFCFAFEQSNEAGVDLKKEEKAARNIVTSNEYRKMKANEVRLSEDTTFLARKYKVLNKLYQNADLIVRTVEQKGLENLDSHLKDYFNDSENFCYDCIEFYHQEYDIYQSEMKSR